MITPLIILLLWGVALTLGVVGVVTRRRKLLFAGMLAALAGLALTYWLKSTLQ
ncbi:DNA repair protein [Desulforamulus putei]|uniref:DNA repair protein n=1 Tax=Desulforamulus putei TaxID=74701 RepID=UPI002FDE2584